MLGKIKLDLINARLDPNFGPRVFDSLEDADIFKSEPIKKSFSQISFKSKEPKILYPKRNSFVPNIFDNAVVDSHGDYLDVSMRVHPKVKNPIEAAEPVPKLNTSNSAKLFTPTLDRIKDKIHEDHREDLIARVRSKKLPGASWSIVSRGEKVIPSNTGPGYYEVYESQLSDYNIRFNSGACGRGESAEFAPAVPIKTRRRLERIEKAKEAEMALKRSASSMRNREEKKEPGEERAPFSSSSSSTAGGIIKFSDAPRFDAPEYKQEPYLKTSGFILSPNFDKSFNKKITFTIRDDSEKKPKKNESLTGNVDVDAGRLFSTMHAVKQSRIKYAAAFK